MADDDTFNQYVKDNLTAGAIDDTGTAMPAESIAQIVQEMIRINPELKNFFGPEIRTGYMDENTYKIYTGLLGNGYHILIRGEQFHFPTSHVVKDILFRAKVIASASTSKEGKFINVIFQPRKDISVSTSGQSKKGLLKK
jgi:hypothetical protein